jgi:hypothetical protein
MIADLKAWRVEMRDGREDTTACHTYPKETEIWLGELKATDLEETLKEIKIVLEQEEVLKEKMEVETIRALETHMGTIIWSHGATESQRNGPREIMAPRISWPPTSVFHKKSK